MWCNTNNNCLTQALYELNIWISKQHRTCHSSIQGTFTVVIVIDQDDFFACKIIVQHPQLLLIILMLYMSWLMTCNTYPATSYSLQTFHHCYFCMLHSLLISKQWPHYWSHSCLQWWLSYAILYPSSPFPDSCASLIHGDDLHAVHVPPLRHTYQCAVSTSLRFPPMHLPHCCTNMTQQHDHPTQPLCRICSWHLCSKHWHNCWLAPLSPSHWHFCSWCHHLYWPICTLTLSLCKPHQNLSTSELTRFEGVCYEVRDIQYFSWIL